MNLRDAMRKKESFEDATLYRLKDPDKLIDYNCIGNRFFSYKIFQKTGDYDRAFYDGRVSLTPQDVLATDWQVRVEPFAVED